MARTVRDAKLESKAARDRLKAGETVHWRTLVPGQLHLGYRRRKAGKPGVWMWRRFVGKSQERRSGYEKGTIGIADDFADADGVSVFAFADAQKIVHTRLADRRLAAARAPLVISAMEDYLSFLRSERKTAADAERRMRAHVLPMLGNVRIDQLSLRQLEDWRAALVEKPARLRTGKDADGNRLDQRYRKAAATVDERRARRATVNRTVTILKAALNRARRHYPDVHDDAWRMLKPFEKTDAARPGHLTIEEAQRLINAADANSGFRAVVQAALLTGARYGELCRLRVGDFAHGRVVVRESKSGKPRDIRLTVEAQAFFSALCAGRPAGETMLLRADGEPFGPSHQARPMKQACERAGIVPAVGIHQLRHTWASLSVMAGMPLLIVAETLGHADLRMVTAHYAHLSADYRDQMIRDHAPSFGIELPIVVVPLDSAKEGLTDDGTEA